ncbi:S8 family serine peptidase [Nocardioides sp. CCNWLW239]|uniref:S8 family serine peptidase n=1 Tax=Nocardioides sp. CCNWLW239 TaxID=3128902 RepID=UPI0030172196
MSLSWRSARAAFPLIAVAALATPLAGFAPAAGAAASQQSAEEIIAALTPDQRLALDQLAEVEVRGLQVDDPAVLAADEPVDVIVSLAQPPARTERLLAASKGHDLTKAQAAERASEARESFRGELGKTFGKGSGVTTEVRRTYDEAFNGFSMRVSGSALEELAAIDGVASVWPDAEVTALSAPGVTTHLASATDGRTQEQIAAGVRRLHEDGITGDGIKVGVIDTGIDYRHPALRDAYVGGYDFIDDDADPMETTYADWKASGRSELSNGNAYYTQHGTHVAGIIAGQDAPGADLGAAGIAPDVDLYAYRVLGPYGSGYTRDILAAMDQALADDMDVVNMSLGAAVNDAGSPQAMAANSLALAGVVTVIAAGNSGPDAYTLGTPGAAALPITVGANDVPMRLPSYLAHVGDTAIEGRLLARPLSSDPTDAVAGTHPVTDVGTGQRRDYTGKDVAGHVVVVDRGAISLNEKVTNAADNGAVAVLLVNDKPEEGHIGHYLGESDDFVPTFSVTSADGAAIAAPVGSGTASVDFTENGTFVLGDGGLAEFSSRGPVFGSTSIKPEVTAPGVSVLSSVPAYMVDRLDVVGDDYQHAYARLSGTSMASPYVAGAAALLLEEDRSRSPEDIKVALMNTAAPLSGAPSVFAAGAGQIDPYRAVHASSAARVAAEAPYVGPGGVTSTMTYDTGALDFGTLRHGEDLEEKTPIQLRNSGDAVAHYRLDVAFTDGDDAADAAANKIALSMPETVTLGPGGQRQTTATLSVPAEAEAGYYEGRVTVTAEETGERLTIPFGFRLATTGLAAVDMIKPVLSTNQGTGAGEAAGGEATFSLRIDGQLRSIDIFVTDKRGEEIGYVGAINTVGLLEGVDYGPAVILGRYFDLTGDPLAPVDPRSKWLTDGHYRLKIVGNDAYGVTDTVTRDIYVDTKAPTYDDEFGPHDSAEPLVVERPADATGREITGTIHDGEIAAIREAGIDIDESDSRILWSQFNPNAPDGFENADTEGRIREQITYPKGPPVSPLWIWPQDAAGNMGEARFVNFADEGYPYLVTDADAHAAGPGDVVTQTIRIHNLADWTGIRASFRYDARLVRITSVTPTEELAALQPTSFDVTDTPNGGSSSGKVEITLPKPVTTAALPTLKVTYEVLDGHWAGTVGISGNSTSGTTSTGTRVNVNTQFYGTVRMLNRTVAFSARPAAEALLTPGYAFDKDRDYSTAGIEVDLIAPDGAVTAVTGDATARFATSLPVTEEPYRLQARVPGHFTWYEEVGGVFRTEEGIGGGSYSTVPALVAGDVNGDDVIDVRDAAEIYAARGSDRRAADIDFDGDVDRRDLAWVSQNYLKQNTTAPTVTAPQLKHRGKSLADYLEMMPG